MACPRAAAALRRVFAVLLPWLLQADARGALAVHAVGSLSAPASTCASLQDHQTHSTVKVMIGTPPQAFDLVADTGSDSLIVESCICQEQHHCSAKDHCFQGTNRSSTFRAPEVSDDGYMSITRITFGSGTIDSLIAADVATVGSDKVLMKDSLLLMVDQQLEIPGPFEGILGLGLPKAEEQSLLVAPDEQPEAGRGPRRAAVGASFLEEGGIPRFSICFNEDGSDGVLQLAQPPAASPELPNIGQMHWGLDFRGVSVGSAPSGPSEVLFCGPEDKLEGQSTACGAIPDSGTTVMMGPAEHILKLYDGICDQWGRCSEAAAQVPEAPKSQVFLHLLQNCSAWAPKGDVSEMPSVHFILGGDDGAEQRLELPAAAYVMRGLAQEVEHSLKYLAGVIPVDLEIPTGRTVEVCYPAFAPQDYNTAKNGQVWIFGTPIFYQYVVHYNMVGKSVSFSDSPCGSCSEDAAAPTSKPAFLTRKSNNTMAVQRSKPHMARRHPGPFRMPGVDATQPL